MDETMLLIAPSDMALTVIAAVALGALIGMMCCWGGEDRSDQRRKRARRRLSQVCGDAVTNAAERERKARWDAVTREVQDYYDSNK